MHMQQFAHQCLVIVVEAVAHFRHTTEVKDASFQDGVMMNGKG